MAEQWKANHCSGIRTSCGKGEQEEMTSWGAKGALGVGGGVWRQTQPYESLCLVSGPWEIFVVSYFFSQELGIDLYIVQKKLRSLATRQDKDIVSKEAGPIDLPWMRKDKIMTPLSYEGSLCKVTQGKLLARGVCLDTSLWKWSWEAVWQCFR